MNRKLPAYFISHGGGPWPWIPEQEVMYRQLKLSLQELAREVGERPKAILVVSGHWEETQFCVSTHPRPGMLYDYYGFPAHTYEVKYPAPGDEKMAQQVVDLAALAGIKVNTNSQRGLDHASFVPLSIMYPEADIPLVQLAVKNNYDVKEHFMLGQALAPLREQGVLMIGSGLSYHNMRGFFERNEKVREASWQFDQWLQQNLMQKSAAARMNSLLNWQDAPAARLVHPREDHLVPLFVVAGASYEDQVNLQYHEENFLGAISVSSFSFGVI